MKKTLKEFIRRAMLITRFYNPQQKKIEWLINRVSELEDTVNNNPNGQSSVEVNTKAIQSILQSIGINQPLNQINGLQVAEAIKSNLFKHAKYSSGGNPNIQPNSEPRVFFFHLPKTAGTSVYSELVRFYHPMSVYSARHILNCKYENSISELALHYGLQSQCITNEEYIQHFPPYLSRLVSGHFSFDLFKQYIDVFDFITILRNPAERLYSEFNYLKFTYASRNQTHAPDTEKLKYHFGKEYFADITLHQFIEQNPVTSHGYNDNLFARLLANNVQNTEIQLKDSSYSKQHYIDTALDNLSKFKFVGFIEELEQFDQFMQNRYQFNDFNVSTRKENITNKLLNNNEKTSKKELWQQSGFSSKKSCLEYISQSPACAIDNQIYAEAVRRYSKGQTLKNTVQHLSQTSTKT
ncbi:MAG: hypothetical protein P1U63_02970 [Coxiellaceae bacterium]|nr:hypothetical protein [Coxiellaceae bacterium]